MQLYIDNRSGTPIYDQIYTQIKSQIIGGDLCAGDALPSIRGLARDLRISVITTKRAYDELESQGLIYTLPGKGSFVAPCDSEQLRAERLHELEEELRRLHALARDCGMDKEALFALYSRMEDSL